MTGSPATTSGDPPNTGNGFHDHRQPATGTPATIAAYHNRDNTNSPQHFFAHNFASLRCERANLNEGVTWLA